MLVLFSCGNSKIESDKIGSKNLEEIDSKKTEINPKANIMDTTKIKSDLSPMLAHFSSTESMLTENDKDSVYYIRTSQLFVRENKYNNGIRTIKLIGSLSHASYKGNIEIIDSVIILYYWVENPESISRKISKYEFTYEIVLPIDKNQYQIKIVYLN